MSLYKDQWATREAWRKHPIFSTRNMFKRLFPGFGLAVVAFTAYVAFDELTHPHNVEGLKKAAKEDQESKVGIATLLKGGDSKH